MDGVACRRLADAMEAVRVLERGRGISWATTVGLSAYFIGQSTSGVFMVFGLVGLSAALLVGGLLLRRSYRAQQAPSAFAEPLS
jgi:hypothetical protein